MRRPLIATPLYSSAASDVYKRQGYWVTWAARLLPTRKSATRPAESVPTVAGSGMVPPAAGLMVTESDEVLVAISARPELRNSGLERVSGLDPPARARN